MIVFAANLGFDRTNNVSIAKAMFNYFLAQYGDAVRRQVSCGADLGAMRAANKAYSERMDSEGLGVGGFYNLPWSDTQIKHKENELGDIDEEVKDAEAIVKFMRDRFLAGMV